MHRNSAYHQSTVLQTKQHNRIYGFEWNFQYVNSRCFFFSSFSLFSLNLLHKHVKHIFYRFCLIISILSFFFFAKAYLFISAAADNVNEIKYASVFFYGSYSKVTSHVTEC